MTEAKSAVAAPRRKRRIRWGRVFMALLVLLVLTEILLRVLGFGNPVLTMRDDACGYRVAPDQHVSRLFSHNDINHFGMRSEEITAARPKGVLRFFFVGDSVTYGTTTVDQSEIFTSRLAKTLPGLEHQRVEVLNQSAGGWSPSNEERYLLANGTFESNVVIFVLNTGDLSEDFAGFPEGNLNYPTARPWTAIGEVLQRYIIPRIRGKMFRDAGTTIADPGSLEQHEAANLAVLTEARDFSRRSHAVFVLAYVPFAGLEPKVIKHSEEVLGKWAADSDVVYLDTAPALAKEDPKLTTQDGMHLKSRGDEVVADEMARQWGKVDAAMKRMDAEAMPPATAK